MVRIPMLGSLVPKGSGRTVALPPKQVDPHYTSEAHRAWREVIIARAGRRCERVENGIRCTRAEPQHRMFANHKVELRDGGDPLDPNNGECLCGSHHTKFTMQQRARRAQSTTTAPQVRKG